MAELRNVKQFTDLIIDGGSPMANVVLLIDSTGSESSVFGAFL